MTGNNHENEEATAGCVLHLSAVPREVPGPVVAHALSFLGRQEQQRWRRLPDHRRRAFLVAHVLLREVLAGCVDRPPESLAFTRGATGRPELTGEGPPFSLSYGEHWSALALALPGTRIGVDVEEAARLRSDPLRLARRYFHDSEAQWLAGLDTVGRVAGFLDLWTRKEAWCKAVSATLAESLPGPCFDVAGDGRLQSAAGTSGTFHCLSPGPGVAVCVCLPDDDGSGAPPLPRLGLPAAFLPEASASV